MPNASLLTADGYTFYLLADGRLVDNLDPTMRDMTYRDLDALDAVVDYRWIYAPDSRYPECNYIGYDDATFADPMTGRTYHTFGECFETMLDAQTYADCECGAEHIIGRRSDAPDGYPFAIFFPDDDHFDPENPYGRDIFSPYHP